MKLERDVVDSIRLAAARELGVRLFVNTSSMAWFGPFAAIKNAVKNIPSVQPKQVGLGKGSPDLIGWKTIKVSTGRVIAVFVAIEVKRPGEKPRPEQETWQSILKEAGAIVGVAHSAEEALRIIEEIDGFDHLFEGI